MPVNTARVNASSKLNHYGDDSDEARWIIEDTTLGSITRNVSGPDGDLAATTSATGDVRLQLTNLHGAVAATIDPALTEPELYDYDEFGIPMAGQADQRYGWLGGKQRSGEAMGDVILMGCTPLQPRPRQVPPGRPRRRRQRHRLRLLRRRPRQLHRPRRQIRLGQHQEGPLQSGQGRLLRLHDPRPHRHHRRRRLRRLLRRHRQLERSRLGHRRSRRGRRRRRSSRQGRTLCSDRSPCRSQST